MPRLKKHILMVPFSGKLAIGSSPKTAIEIEDPNGLVFNIMRNCDGEKSVNEIWQSVKKDYPTLDESSVVEIIEQIAACPYLMEDAQVVKGDLTEEELDRHSRNLNFLSNFDPEGNKKHEYMRAILNSKVLLIGLGGVGSSVLYNLGALGVKEVVGVDFDRVDRTNLNRQILYRENHIGEFKIDAAKETINGFNEKLNFIGINKMLNSATDLDEIVEQYKPDVIICAADKPPLVIYDWCNQVSFKHKVPYIYGGNSEATSYYHTVVPGETSCFNCRIERFKEEGWDEALAKFHAIMDKGYDIENNCIAASSSSLGSYMTFDFIRLITKVEAPKAADKITFMDYRNLTLDSEDIKMSCHCKYCNGEF